MFQKLSRYYKLPDEVTADASGRTLRSKSLRLLPPVAGRFLHRVEAGDRLDHLAFKYYRQPQKWWRICDGNPDFLSPLDLVGDEPVVTDRFPLTLIDQSSPPPWAALRREVMRLLGVVDLQILEAAELVERLHTVGGDEVPVFADAFQRAALVIYNPRNVGIAALVAAMETAGFSAGAPVRTGRVGKAIVIPPDSVR